MEFHPEYNQHKNDWDFFENSYIGGKDWLGAGNIFQHAREEKDTYDKRVQRAIYTNYCRPIIEIFLSFIYGVDTHRQRMVEDTDFESFVTDVDLRRNTLDDFMSRCGTFAQVYGHVGVLVDMPQVDESQVLSLADVRDLGIRPYLTCYHPQDIVNWATDRFGRLKWVKLKELVRQDDNPFADKMETDVQIRTWTTNTWTIQDEEDQILAMGQHPLGRVPFVPVYYQRHPKSDFVGLSQIYDISRINRMIANVMSYIDEFCAKQAFPVWAEEDDGMEQEGGQIIGTENAYRFPQGGQPPVYVSPPTDPATFMKQYIQDTLVREIYRIAKLEHRILNEQSGVAKEMDFHETDNALVKYARNLELAETQIISLWAQWQGKEPEISVDYPDSFNIGSVDAALEETLKVQQVFMGQSERFVSEHLKRLARRIQPKLEEDVRRIIDGELDDAAVAQSQAVAFENELRAVA